MSRIKIMKILLAASEALPFIKTGGLGDVIGALVKEYPEMGVETTIVLPLYRNIKKAARDFGITSTGKEITVPLGEELETGTIWEGKTPEGVRTYFIENDKFYDRDEPYSTGKAAYPDNFERFTFYDRAVLELLKTLKLSIDVIHCNDWHTGLIPVYIKTLYKDDFPRTATLMTIHNLGYQGLFRALNMPLTGLGWDIFSKDGLESRDKIGFLKAGILFADIINTVSDTYAREVLTEEYGFRLDKVLREKSGNLYGIINGLDYNEWDPENDTLIEANYSMEGMAGKKNCKKKLQQLCGFSADGSFLIGMVTRISSQKGLDLVLNTMDEIIRSGTRMMILGKGEEGLQKTLKTLEKKYSGQLKVFIGFDNSLAHKIYAGADAFLMPSKYEPCGLGQLIAMRYGTVPVVRRTGGLADTVTEYDQTEGSGTGFSFGDYSSEEMLKAISRAKDLFNNKEHWLNIRRNGMSQNFSWRRSAEKYVSLYQKALKQKDL